jgi:hypothetical protein
MGRIIPRGLEVFLVNSVLNSPEASYKVTMDTKEQTVLILIIMIIIIIITFIESCNLDRSDGNTTRYALCDRVIEVRFPERAKEFTQSHRNEGRGSFHGTIPVRTGANYSFFFLVPRLRMRRLYLFSSIRLHGVVS